LIALLLFFGIYFAVNPQITSPQQRASLEVCRLKSRGKTNVSGIFSDDDGRIWLSGTDKQDSRRQSIEIGVNAASRAPRSEELALVPKGETPIDRQQFACKKAGWTAVVITTVKPVHVEDRLSVENILHVILFRGPRGELILTRKYPQIDRMTIGDINGDGSPELAVQWTEGGLISPATWSDIWLLKANGRLTSVDLRNIRQDMQAELASNASTVDWGKYQVGDFSISSVQRIVHNGITESIQRFYGWNGQRERYEFQNKTVIEERVIDDKEGHGEFL
jgi:hypothetical protein